MTKMKLGPGNKARTGLCMNLYTQSRVQVYFWCYSGVGFKYIVRPYISVLWAATQVSKFKKKKNNSPLFPSSLFSFPPYLPSPFLPPSLPSCTHLMKDHLALVHPLQAMSCWQRDSRMQACPVHVSQHSGPQNIWGEEEERENRMREGIFSNQSKCL